MHSPSLYTSSWRGEVRSGSSRAAPLRNRVQIYPIPPSLSTPKPLEAWLVEMLTKWLTLSCPELCYLTGFQKVHLTVFPDSRPDLGFPKWERVQSSHPHISRACCGLLPLPFALEAGCVSLVKWLSIVDG